MMQLNPIVFFCGAGASIFGLADPSGLGDLATSVSSGARALGDQIVKGALACTCSDFESSAGFGPSCKKSYKGGPICYVNEPSSCTDLVLSDNFPDKIKRYYSYQACGAPWPKCQDRYTDAIGTELCLENFWPSKGNWWSADCSFQEKEGWCTNDEYYKPAMEYCCPKTCGVCADVPESLSLPVRIHLHPSWIAKFPGKKANRMVKDILQRAQKMLQDPSLGVKFDLRYTDVEPQLEEDYPKENDDDHQYNPLNEAGVYRLRDTILKNLTREIPDYPFIVAYFTAETTPRNTAVRGQSFGHGSICRKPRTDPHPPLFVVRYNDDGADPKELDFSETTAQMVAHEIGHILGMDHNEGKCNRDENGEANNFIMTDENPKDSTWSTCTRDEFKAFWDEEMSKGEPFCLAPPAPYNGQCGGNGNPRIHCESSYTCDLREHKCRVGIDGDCSSETCSSEYTCDGSKCIEYPEFLAVEEGKVEEGKVTLPEKYSELIGHYVRVKNEKGELPVWKMDAAANYIWYSTSYFAWCIGSDMTIHYDPFNFGKNRSEQRTIFISAMEPVIPTDKESFIEYGYKGLKEIEYFPDGVTIKAVNIVKG